MIPGAVCLLLGGAFILLFRYSRKEQEDADRRLIAEAWGMLADIEERTEEDIEKRVCTRYYGIYEYDAAELDPQALKPKKNDTGQVSPVC